MCVKFCLPLIHSGPTSTDNSNNIMLSSHTSHIHYMILNEQTMSLSLPRLIMCGIIVLQQMFVYSRQSTFEIRRKLDVQAWKLRWAASVACQLVDPITRANRIPTCFHSRENPRLERNGLAQSCGINGLQVVRPLFAGNTLSKQVTFEHIIHICRVYYATKGYTNNTAPKI